MKSDLWTRHLTEGWFTRVGPKEKEIFGYLEKARTVAEVAGLLGVDVKWVRPAIRRLLVAGYVEKQDTPGRSNHETRYKIRTDWTEVDLKPKPRGPQGKPRPKKPKKIKERFNVLGVWI
jgi:hypothetical protein